MLPRILYYIFKNIYIYKRCIKNVLRFLCNKSKVGSPVAQIFVRKLHFSDNWNGADRSLLRIFQYFSSNVK